MGMAIQLYNDLKRYGLDVWLDTESSLYGDQWKDRILYYAENCDYLIALISKRSMNNNGLAQKELGIALEVWDLFPAPDRIILPVRLDSCALNERRLKQFNCIDLYPESEYSNGLKKILHVVCKKALLLRSTAKCISESDAAEMIRRFGFYDMYKNPEGKNFEHRYNLRGIGDNRIIIDEATGLMWQQGGSESSIKYEDAEEMIRKHNEYSLAGFNDWRLPTLEEAMSLMEPKKQNGLYINPIFNSKQRWVWMSDLFQGVSEGAWVVDFGSGCNWTALDDDSYVRAVRTEQSPIEYFDHLIF